MGVRYGVFGEQRGSPEGQRAHLGSWLWWKKWKKEGKGRLRFWVRVQKNGWDFVSSCHWHTIIFKTLVFKRVMGKPRPLQSSISILPWCPVFALYLEAMASSFPCLGSQMVSPSFISCVLGQILFLVNILWIFKDAYGFLPACMSMYHVYAWCPVRTEEGAGSLETRVVDPCELPCDAGNHTQALCTSCHCS